MSLPLPVAVAGPEELVVDVIERHQASQLRVSVVRLPGRRAAMVRVSLWNRKVGEDWQIDVRSRRGSSLLRAGEVPRVTKAMTKAVERAREIGWEIW